MTHPIEDAIFELLSERGAGKSICPSEAARRVEPDSWRRMMPHVRATAIALMREGRLVVLKKGKPVDPDAFKGVIRLRLP